MDFLSETHIGPSSPVFLGVAKCVDRRLQELLFYSSGLDGWDLTCSTPAPFYSLAWASLYWYPRWLLVHVCKYSSHCVDWTHSFSPQRLINEDMPSTQSIKRNGTLTLSSCEAYNEVGGEMDSMVWHLLVIFSITYLGRVCNFTPRGQVQKGWFTEGYRRKWLSGWNAEDGEELAGPRGRRRKFWEVCGDANAGDNLQASVGGGMSRWSKRPVRWHWRDVHRGHPVVV